LAAENDFDASKAQRYWQFPVGDPLSETGVRPTNVNKFREMLVNASGPGIRPEKGRDAALL